LVFIKENTKDVKSISHSPLVGQAYRLFITDYIY